MLSRCEIPYINLMRFGIPIWYMVHVLNNRYCWHHARRGGDGGGYNATVESSYEGSGGCSGVGAIW